MKIVARKKKIIETKIIDNIFPNKSIAENEDRTIIFKGGIKGQKVRVLLGKKKKNYTEGKLLEVLERSPLEKNLSCFHDEDCGGCTYQTLLYEDELKLKKDQVLALFEKEKIEDFNFLGIEGSPKVEGYRNKMEYTFGDEEKGGPLVLGLHKRGRFYEIVDSDACNIADKDFTTIRRKSMEYFRRLNTPYYNKRTHEGILRHLVIRKALSTGEILINLVTTSQGNIDTDNFVKELLELEGLEGEIIGILHTINDGLGDIVKADELKILYGKDYITEEILGLKFKVSPFSFFQTNTFGAEKLYSIAKEFAGDINDKVVFDLYSGTGTIAQIMAQVAKKVVAIEIVEEAVMKARENAQLNELYNIEFVAGDVLKEVENLKGKPDLVIVDPPRDGIHPKAINKIIDFNPDTFVYVSCNPITLVRDLKVFIERGYKVEKVKLMDMFPRTPQLVTNEETKGVSETFWIEYGMNYEDFCNTYKVEELEITSSFDEHIIPADYIYSTESQNSKEHQTVILVHGLGGNRYSNYPLAEFFLKKGYNVITYDQRSSNENTVKYTTFGYWEKYDLMDWINYVEEKAPGQKIGVWGASFGGTTAGLALGYEGMDDKVDFLILDCPVSSMEWMVEEEMRDMDIGIPVSYMRWCGNIINKLKLGFSYQDADVAAAMINVKTPVLIINSKVDSLTPYFMGKDIYDAIQGKDKEIWTVDDSEHCEMWIDHNQEYCNKVESFLIKYE